MVFTKAETEMKDEEQFMQDEVEEGLKEDTEEEPKILPEEDSEEDTPKKVILRSLYLTMKVPTNHNFYFFRTSYCVSDVDALVRNMRLIQCEIKLALWTLA